MSDISLTIEDLDEAIEDVMTSRLYNALKSGTIGRPGMHDMACLLAFQTNRQDYSTEVLRTMLAYRSEHGLYPENNSGHTPGMR
jgi:hypothetical protein